jgi:aminomethyltransferase
VAEALRHSPLDAEHRALGARLVEFGGWEMPIQYSSVLAEHRCCRDDAVVFDVSHLGTVRVHGPDARDLLQWAFTNDLDRIAPGRAQYTHLLDPADGSVVDDIIVWWLAPDDLLVMPNASNTQQLTDALREGSPRHPDVAMDDITSTRVVLAVQGPRARERVAKLDEALAAVGRFRVARVDHGGVELVVAGTGYTGEDGIEILVPAADAPALWRAVLGTGVTPAGLGARDTLRLEAGLPLHGHELGPGITPLQAGLAWVVRFDKGDFRGRAPLERERDAGPARRLVGLSVEGRQPPRAGATVLRDGEVAGFVTSGNFSPTLGHGIALALVQSDVPDEGDVELDLRSKRVPARLTKPPFVAKR